MKIKGIIIPILLLLIVFILSIIVCQSEIEKRAIKKDFIELSNIKYGIFSIDEWKEIIAIIITKKIKEYNLDGVNRVQLRQKVSVFLAQQIDKYEVSYYEERSHTFSGFLQATVADVTNIFGHIKKQIPNTTDDILNFINDPKNRGEIRNYILKKLNEYADKTFSKIDYSIHDKIIAKYNFNNRKDALVGLNAIIEDIDNKNRSYELCLIMLAILTSLYIIFSKVFSKNEFMILTIICMTFLVTGLLLPMIEIDARISEFSFSLLGEPVSFHDQVLYFKSKSILEVVQLMITQGRLDLIFVGLLVLTFSVIFPISKLISSVVYIYSTKLKSNKFIQFMVFKTGKWSMADVMVIAIFMAYIGFTGIITEQLKQIESIAPNIDILTTNKSSLLAGFFSFTSFVILSLLLSYKLQYKFKVQENTLR
jgi:hypothetical protein